MAGKGPGTPRVPEEAGAQPGQRRLRTSRGVRTPAEVPDPCIVTGPLTKGRRRHPAPRWSGADTCLQEQTRIQGRLVSLLSLTHHCIHCGRWTPALMQQKPRRFFDQEALLIAYYQGAYTTKNNTSPSGRRVLRSGGPNHSNPAVFIVCLSQS